MRIITSSSRDLPSLIAEQKFREDLYYRLGVVPVRVPGLNERREDIPELLEFFSKSFSVGSGQPQRHFANDAIAVLQTRNWPGNVRELRNNVERMLILASGDPQDEITADMMPAEILAENTASGFGGEHLLTMPLREAREAFERDYVAAQLSRFGGNISRTSTFIGMERSALHRKIKMLGLTSKEEDGA